MTDKDKDTGENISSSKEGEVVMDSMGSFIQRGSITETVDVVDSDRIDHHEVAQSTPLHSIEGETSVKNELKNINKDIANLQKCIEEINSNINAKFQDLKELFALIEPKNGRTK